MSAILHPGSVELRSMQNKDLHPVMIIEEMSYSHPWTHGIFRDCLRVGYHCQVLEIKGEIQAYAVMSQAVGEAHILNVCVHPDFQGSGLGKMLVEYCLDTARRMSTEIVLLEVRPSNKVALSLYDNMGFCEVGVRRNYYPSHNGREDALILALNL